MQRVYGSVNGRRGQKRNLKRREKASTISAPIERDEEVCREAEDSPRLEVTEKAAQARPEASGKTLDRSDSQPQLI